MTCDRALRPHTGFRLLSSSARRVLAATMAALVLTAGLRPLPGMAQESRPVASKTVAELPHSTEHAVIDGSLDDAIWRDALVVDLTIETGPDENVPAPVATHAYLVEDGERLLIAFDARDPNPKAIRAYLRDRDTAYNDDFVGVVVDTFGDQRHAYEFFVNPLGVQMDLTNDDVNSREDDSWDAIWDSAGKITPEGFVVEMAIPFSQLRFPHTQGERTWGIDVLRFYPRKDRVRISNNRLERGRNCYLCQFSQIRGLAGVAPSDALELVPSLTASRTDTRADPVTDPLQKGNTNSDVGVNLKWGVTQDLTANIALNPDFSQVEADVAQLDVNNQFALFYPEKRPFFLEGADYFTTPIQAVFTRTVADPDAGAKLTGQTGRNAFGFFVAKDATTNLLFPDHLASSTDSLDVSNDVFVGRYRRNVGDGSTVGALVTSRDGGDYRNALAGVDARLRISGAHSLQLQYLTSATRYPDATAAQFGQPVGDFDGDAFQTRYTYSTRNWYADWTGASYDNGFRADSGFVPRVGVADQKLELTHIWQGTTGHWWNQIRVGLNGHRIDDRDNGVLERTLEPYFSFNGPLQSYVQISRGPTRRFWNGQTFSGQATNLYAQLRPIGGLSVQLNARRGAQVDLVNSRLGFEHRLQPNIQWNVNRHMLVRLQNTSVRLNAENGPLIFDANLADLRVTWQFNVRSFVRFTTQRQRIERNVSQYLDPSTEPKSVNVGQQLLYAYKLNPQTVLYVGYSDSAIEDSSVVDLTRTGRTFFAKLSYAWLH